MHKHYSIYSNDAIWLHEVAISMIHGYHIYYKKTIVETDKLFYFVVILCNNRLTNQV